MFKEIVTQPLKLWALKKLALQCICSYRKVLCCNTLYAGVVSLFQGPRKYVMVIVCGTIIISIICHHEHNFNLFFSKKDIANIICTFGWFFAGFVIYWPEFSVMGKFK